ncbi:NHP2 ribonucleoprotein [Leptinotarsa decemlineata]|uniref:NHP2 ribonucleoprotein n=1 Tax=Leptinotarsa decemlineata TaxID=7539 RepID=UPI000C25332B|nr:H/ACA ribonucleoprotein complex subunit 2-like protein [Leptinotarsa decemlineata]
MGKIKEEPRDTADMDVSVKEEPELSYEDKISHCSVIAKPMASKKLAKKTYKLLKKALSQKTQVRVGLKDVQKRIRKGETGILVLAGDIHPIEIMCHLPIVCEEKNIPYVFVPSRKDLGAALGVKRGCVMVLIKPHEDYKENFNELKEEVNSLGVPLL